MSSNSDSVEGDGSPSSPHMSNSKNNELDCDTDAGRSKEADDSKEMDEIIEADDKQLEECAADDEENEPPRKRARTGLNKEVNGNIEFEIIDEVEADDDDLRNIDVSDDDLSDGEIYAWLEEGIDKQAQAETEDSEPVEKEKVVLKEKGHDPFDILPEGWVVVTHNSGMPVYLHKESRVCTLARPYFLGPGSVRKHDIPLSAIPCLQYRRQLEKESSEGREEDRNAGVSESNQDADNSELQEKPYSKSGNTISCSSMEKDFSESGVVAGVMETEKHVWENYKSSLAVGQKASISETRVITEEMDVDSSCSALVTSKRDSSINLGVVDEKSQLVTNQCGQTPGPQFPLEPVPEGADEVVANGGEASSSNNIEESDGNGNDCSQEDQENSQAAKDNPGNSRLEVNPVKVESAEERRKQASLDPVAVRDYCSRLFEFRTITVRKYKTWRDRRKHMMQMKKQSRPELPPNTKLITCSLNVQGKPGDLKSAKRKEFLLNPSGKSSVCILHEYVQHTMRVQPRYIFKEMESAQTPYSATVVINDVEYGVGYASSKKAAKLDAAKATLNIFIPEMNKVTEETGDREDLSFFDEIKIEDPRIYELGNKAGQPSPYQILCECLRRNYGLGETQCICDMKRLKQQKSEFTMTVGKHTATVIAKNKRDGKQRAAQAILQKLHPHVTCWGSLLRLYGKSSEKYFSEKKDDMNINELQAQVKANRPNVAILNRLKDEMTRLHMQRGAIQSKGKLRVESLELPAKVPSLDL